jgi:hypothetical protein
MTPEPGWRNWQTQRTQKTLVGFPFFQSYCRNLDLGLSAPFGLCGSGTCFRRVSATVQPQSFWGVIGSSSVQPPQEPPYPSKSSPCQNAAGDREVDGEGIEEARRCDLLVRAEIRHLGIRRCVSNPLSNRGRLTVWESHDLAQIQQILICCD